jgi:biotin carboxyl carrier protein
MKMQMAIHAPTAGKVVEVGIAPDQRVDKNARLILID